MADDKNSPATQMYAFPELGLAVEATDLKDAEAKAKKLTEKK